MATPWSKNEYAVKSEKGVERISITKDAELSNQNTLVIAGQGWYGFPAVRAQERICEPNSNFLESTNLSVANNSRKQ